MNTGGDTPLTGATSTVRWYWFYHVPSLPLWILVAALLVAIPSNRNWQAGLILVPLIAVSLMWRMVARLFGLAPETAEALGGFSITLAMAWAITWLVVQHVEKQFAAVRFAAAALIMMTVGFAAYVFFVGTQLTEEFVGLAIFFAICVVTLLVSFASAAFCCRAAYSPGRFLGWLLLWTMISPVVVGVVVGIVGMSIAAAFSHDLGDLFLQVVFGAIMLVVLGGVVGTIIYVFNLPFMVLFVNSPLYQTRFRNVLRLPESPPDGEIPLRTLPSVAAPLDGRYDGSSPFREPSPGVEASSAESAVSSAIASDGP
jgi:hypothetical protein